MMKTPKFCIVLEAATANFTPRNLCAVLWEDLSLLWRDNISTVEVSQYMCRDTISTVGVSLVLWRDTISTVGDPPKYWTPIRTVLMASPTVLMISLRVLMVSLHFTEYPPQYWWYPPQYWWYPPQYWALSTVLNIIHITDRTDLISPLSYGIPHSIVLNTLGRIEYPLQCCTEVPQGD